MQRARVVYHRISMSHLYFLGSCVYQENTTEGQSRYSMLYHERTLHNYFIPYHRRYSGRHNQCDIRAAHDGKVGCNAVEYTTAYLYSDWLNFLWHGLKTGIDLNFRFILNCF